MKITAFFNEKEVAYTQENNSFQVEIPETVDDTFLEFRLEREVWDKEEFILLPGAAYNGNRFDSLQKNYPPMFTLEEAKVDMPITITGSPARLNKDGSGRIAVTSGDLTVPCIGIYDRQNKKGVLLYTEQQVKGKNVGFAYENGVISLSVPHDRNHTVPQTPHQDRGLTFEKGEKVIVPYRLLEFDCEKLTDFYQEFFDNRKIMGMDTTYSPVHGCEKIFDILETKFNEKNFPERLEAYTVGIVEDYEESPSRKFQTWQPGWVGGAMTSYPLMKCGSELSYERGIKTLEFLFSTQKSSGFFPGVVDVDRTCYSDAFGEEGADDWHLLRKSADVLLFLFKHYEVMEAHGDKVPEDFLAGTRKLADAFVRLWQKYGQFGQFVSDETGDILVGGSISAGIAPGALAKAAEYFEEDTYLETAKASGEYYYQKFLEDGCTTGGPGEILQCPDSESAFGLLESMITLYEVTKEEKWLTYTKAVANYCSSWVVSYNYHFPETSEFGRLDMHTTGSVYANAQNKHSAPGICTLSGDSLYRYYKATGDERYLELIRDIANNVFQYISTEERPIYAKLDDGMKLLPPGYVNERVNMSDWETEGRVGEVFFGSTWAETSALLTWAELRELLVI